jgi:hypothetical protein
LIIVCFLSVYNNRKFSINARIEKVFAELVLSLVETKRVCD